MNEFILLRKNGNKLQELLIPYTVKSGKEYLVDFISRDEFADHDTGECVIYEPTLHLFQAVRRKIGPIIINSGYRTKEHQEALYKKDLESNSGKPTGKVANPKTAPHCTGAAMDLAIPKGYTAVTLAKIIRDTSVDMGLPMARTIYKKYDNRFVHFDLVFMLFEPYTQTPNPVPALWTPGLIG